MGDGIALGLQIGGNAFKQIIMAGFSKLQGRTPEQNTKGQAFYPKPGGSKNKKYRSFRSRLLLEISASGRTGYGPDSTAAQLSNVHSASMANSRLVA